jgi:ribulose kinase
MIDDVQWFVGIDWATQSHRVGLLDCEGRLSMSATSPMAEPG